MYTAFVGALAAIVGFMAGAAALAAVDSVRFNAPGIVRRLIAALPTLLLLLTLVLVAALVFTIIVILEPTSAFGDVVFGEAVNQGQTGAGATATGERSVAPLFSAAAVAASALIVLLTFVFGQAAARRQAMQQHTITLLFQNMLGNSWYQEQRQRMGRRFGQYDPIPARLLQMPSASGQSLLDSDWYKQFLEDQDRHMGPVAPQCDGSCGACEREKQELDLRKDIDAAIYLLNFYENIAAAIHFGDLDGAMIRTSIGASIVVTVTRNAELIADLRQPPEPETVGGAAGRKVPREILEHLVALYEDWLDPQLIQELEGKFKEVNRNLAGGRRHPVDPAVLHPVPKERRDAWRRQLHTGASR